MTVERRKRLPRIFVTVQPQLKIILEGPFFNASGALDIKKILP